MAEGYAPGLDGSQIPAPSRGIMRRVMYSLSDKPFVTYDSHKDRKVAGRQSVLMSGVRAVICTGLVTDGICEGVVYLDSQGATSPFTAGDEKFIHLIAQMIAARLATLRARDELESLREEIKSEAGVRAFGPIEVS
jgi:GAF domain-containing protein